MERRKTPFLAQRATQLRNGRSATEELLWTRIRNRQVRGYRFRRRPIVLGRIPSFGCSEGKLVIVIDGIAYPGKKKRDDARAELLAKHGVRTVHLPSELIWKDMDEAVRLISERLPKSPSKTGRATSTLRPVARRSQG